MVKNVLKELIIILLLTLAIILLLGVILYDYVPMNKVIPEKVSYIASEEVRQISSEINEKKEEIPITSYTVTSTDLKNYKRVNDYTAGRKNPFAAVESSGGTGGTAGGNVSSGTTNSGGSTASGSTGNSANSGTTNSGASNGGTTSTNKNNTNYYPDKGIK